MFKISIHYCMLKIGPKGVCQLLKAAMEQKNTEVLSTCVSEMKIQFFHNRHVGSFYSPYSECLLREYGPILGFRGVFEVLKSSLQDEDPAFVNACVDYFKIYIRHEYEVILPIAEELAELGQPLLLEECQKFRETIKVTDENPSDTNKGEAEKL